MQPVKNIVLHLERIKFMRKKVIAANWKMNKTPEEAVLYIEQLKKIITDNENIVVILAPFIDLIPLINLAQGSKIKIGAQNMHFEDSGAFTGEISGKMLKAIGAEYVVIGHSERKQYFNETDETVNKKLKAAFKYGLKPIVCVGETIEQREQGLTQDLITKQIKAALDGLSGEQILNTIIAYEPIWAIGTGRSATAAEANATIHDIRETVASMYGRATADEIIIQYGGSVNSRNFKELFEMPDIDGGLIGSASLDAIEFSKLINE
jgi:triosephosphate isomerase